MRAKRAFRSDFGSRQVERSRRHLPSLAFLSTTVKVDSQSVLLKWGSAVRMAGAHDTTIGYLCCLISCLGFGSNYLFVKRVDVKDGMFFTLCLSFGVWCIGVLQWMISGLYAFEPFAMLGGMLWAIGNLCVPFIIHHCGLGIGQLVWSVTNMLTGWASGAFGLFGKDKDHVAHASLNYAGVAMAIMSLGLFKLIKGTSSEASQEGLVNTTSSPSARGFAKGFAVALVCGAFFGSNFNPPTYLQQIGQRDTDAGLTPRHSPDATDYVFSHFSGIFATTAAAFAVAAARGHVHTGREMVLPGILSGALWGIAQVAWFRANGVLSYVVAFPIIVGVPGIIAALWGVVLFGENRGRHNLSVLALVIVVQVVAVSLIAASKG
ncbi:unnamed protein product [Prorocentrum cordatum]|uniref:Transmembrane protein 144 n=1 Tax=Prorocentrum cordatum TaxID=2364126 RepID=A0ABN9T7I9_9DINO|nr:unnamed protein product [Polarella glacialis]